MKPRLRFLSNELIKRILDEAYKLQVPGGGLLWDEYEIASTVIDADVWINVPVAKTHGAKITCCMKNHFGLLPGKLYGWSKATGTEDHPGMPHAPRIIDQVHQTGFLLRPLKPTDIYGRP